ncbi:hypothetical protein EDD16DRAFT_1516546 [Pisolithus croceorrhizus]|nr:hypothetical protein EDD16DRAFT_1516546 [Pisolithus croceorrhizus]KAI6158543.1 hypothetical protein EDD17DRAFT_1512112 [Pisolithus thermaeus]
MDKYEEAGPKKVEKLVEKEVESKLHEAFNVFAVEKARSPLLLEDPVERILRQVTDIEYTMEIHWATFIEVNGGQFHERWNGRPLWSWSSLIISKNSTKSARFVNKFILSSIIHRIVTVGLQGSSTNSPYTYEIHASGLAPPKVTLSVNLDEGASTYLPVHPWHPKHSKRRPVAVMMLCWGCWNS